MIIYSVPVNTADIWTYGARRLQGNRMNQIGDAVVASGAGVKGAYVQLNAGVGQNYYGLLIKLRCEAFANDRDFLVDIAVGAAGVETVVVSNVPLKYHMIAAPASTFENGAVVFVPVFVPVNSRVAARSQSAAADNVSVTVEGAYEV